MAIHWQHLGIKLLTWFATELILGYVGLDDIANYSEFIFEKHCPIDAIAPSITLVALAR